MEGETAAGPGRNHDEDVTISSEEAAAAAANHEGLLNGRKVSWTKLRRVDSLNLEAGRVSSVQPHQYFTKEKWGKTLILAFQSIGVIYGDIGTSPLYVYSSTFPKGIIKNKNDILGVLSLIIYTILLIPLLKYVFIVLAANDNGDGGTFALYSLICRYCKVSLIPNHQPEDRELSNYKLDTPSSHLRRAQRVRNMLEKSKWAKLLLFLITILGTSMVIGDGVLTPCISVLSAVSGIKRSAKSLNQDAIVGISVAILILLFSAQRFGTDKVGYTFAPIICLWFALIAGIGLYNLFKFDVGVLRAFNPKYIVDYFTRNGKEAWVSLGGIVLCITGTEAMFADLGHFSLRAVQISFSSTVFPAILCAYAGQAAYLTKFPGHVTDTFYKSIPGPLYWPMFVVAVAAAVIASQAMISGAFAIISQSLTLGCFPRVKIVHTSAKYEGQVYIPEINYILMIACVIVTVAFRTTEQIGNAYGIAVVAVMIITTFMVSLIMLIIWKTSILWIALFFVVFGAIELVYFSSVLYKFAQGGFLPLAFSLVLMVIMGVWHYVHKEKYMFELNNKISSSLMKELVSNPDLSKAPGIGLLYSELVQGVPPIFHHFISNIPSIHSVVVFVSIKHIPISKVAIEERFLFRQVESRENRMFRCIVRYGYKDVMEGPEFEEQLVKQLKEFVRHEHFILEKNGASDQQTAAQVVVLQPEAAINIPHSGLLAKETKVRGQGSSTVHIEEGLPQPNNSISSRRSSGSIRPASATSGRSTIGDEVVQGAEEEMRFIQKAMDKGVVYLLGETEVVAKPNSSVLKVITVNYIYNFLKKNFRQGEKIMVIPQSRLVRVGMTYEI
ncbi:hypothetical protein Sjap_023153 [Stephania japonica]|uniref:Potassium transporter n=1 Tax=Stephania japonica TaxID=461633 RepID=A0AAP0EB33_9MAGN